MTKTNLYALKDTVTGTFGPVVAHQSDAEAQRAIGAHMRIEMQSFVAMYPENYQLWKLAEYNQFTGVISCPDDHHQSCDPEYLCDCLSLSPKPQVEAA